MTHGPRDVFHSLSCLLATLSGGQSKTLTLLQGKMAAAKLPFQQIPRFIELEEDHTRSLVSVEPTYTNSATEFPIYKYSENPTASAWMDETAPSQFIRPGISSPTVTSL